MEDWQHGGFGLYIHWPYCESKCPYCDFNSHVATSVNQVVWQKAFLSEIDRIGAQTRGRRLDTIFFGGGTPSLMNPDLVGAVIERAKKTWVMRNDPEITLEANPGSIEAGRFKGYHDAGVTRISMGMQAMNDEDLRKLGRKHTALEARNAFEIARNCFERVSFDLIYARQDQTLAEWSTELQMALKLSVDHLSLYQLTIEDGTAFAERLARGGLKGLPKDDVAADMYELTQELMGTAAMQAYEVSNHAKVGAECFHNMIYWRGGDYIGIGPGAHGRLTINQTRWATEAPKSPEIWLQLVESEQSGELKREALTKRDHSLEYLMMSLRLREGMSVERFNAISPARLCVERVTYLTELNMLEADKRMIRATTKGRLVLNSLIRELADY